MLKQIKENWIFQLIVGIIIGVLSSYICVLITQEKISLQYLSTGHQIIIVNTGNKAVENTQISKTEPLKIITNDKIYDANINPQNTSQGCGAKLIKKGNTYIIDFQYIDKQEQIEVDFLTPDESFSYNVRIAGHGFNGIKEFKPQGNPYPPMLQVIYLFGIFFISIIVLGFLLVAYIFSKITKLKNEGKND
jgi:hypothetical protein